MSLAGYISIDRENASMAMRSMEAAAERIRRGTSVVVFPEGTRSDSGRLLEFKKGPFLLAVKSGVDVVPVALDGTNGIMKRGSLMISPAEVRLSVGPPIETRGRKTKELIEITREAVRGLLEGRDD